MFHFTVLEYTFSSVHCQHSVTMLMIEPSTLLEDEDEIEFMLPLQQINKLLKWKHKFNSLGDVKQVVF